MVSTASGLPRGRAPRPRALAPHHTHKHGKNKQGHDETDGVLDDVTERPKFALAEPCGKVEGLLVVPAPEPINQTERREDDGNAAPKPSCRRRRWLSLGA